MSVKEKSVKKRKSCNGGSEWLGQLHLHHCLKCVFASSVLGQFINNVHCKVCELFALKRPLRKLFVKSVCLYFVEVAYVAA